MQQIYKTTLQTGELYVLAGLLRYHSIIGVETATLQHWQKDLRHRVAQAVGRLEKKKAVLYGLDGSLQMDGHLHTVMDCLCAPDGVYIISGDGKTGRYSSVYVLIRGSHTVLLSRLSADSYKISLYGDFAVQDLIGPRLQDAGGHSVHERLLFEEVQCIKGLIDAFQPEEARRMLENRLSDEKSVQPVLDVLSGKNRFIKVQRYEKEKSVYLDRMNCFISLQEGGNLRLYLDEYQMFMIDTIGKNECLELLCSELTERGNDGWRTSL